MNQQEFCQDCHQRHDCREVYRQLGSAESPSIVFKVIVVFLLPMVIFVASLAVFEFFLTDILGATLNSSQSSDSVNIQKLQTLLGFFSALFITFICMFIIKTLNRRIKLI
jgi:fucose 4-O-acetylase-like acetyltransferase